VYEACDLIGMEDLFVKLCETDGCLREAKCELRKQQAIIPEMHLLSFRLTVIALLSHGLRTFAWLENQRNSLLEAIRHQTQTPNE
jgi:hypothetical protein